MEISRVTIEECEGIGLSVYDGAKIDSKDCQFHQNGGSGVFVVDATAHLTNCTSHHNKQDGVCASSGVVDLMGEGTSVHDNKRHGLGAVFHGSTINVYQPCVLKEMSHGNKGKNIRRFRGSIVVQKDSTE